ncbi:hypothetical protein MMC28_000055 [Mycoblastus sanguinarius]|nr:hypothetical protein [Mycoblastus sanguinarius]
MRSANVDGSHLDFLLDEAQRARDMRKAEKMGEKASSPPRQSARGLKALGIQDDSLHPYQQGDGGRNERTQKDKSRRVSFLKKLVGGGKEKGEKI